RSDLSPSIPPATTVRSLSIDGETLTVDFGDEIVRDHSGGSAGEIITVYSVVNTLTELPGVRWVAWRIDGRTVESLVGHLDLSRPIGRNDDVVVLERSAADGR